MPMPEPRSDLALRGGYHSPQADVTVRLNTNESPLPPPPDWLDAVADELRHIPFNRYPDRSAAGLREALASFHGVRPDQVFCANGSNEVLQTLLLSYGGPGRRAVVFEPTYALHAHITRITATDLIEAERGDDFLVSPTEARLLVDADRPSVVFLCSPNNPTGTVEPREAVEAILAAVVAAGSGLLVVDEAYGEFAGWSATELVEDDVPLVVVRTYSKVWSMAALRLGFAVAPPAVVEQLERVVLPYHLATPTQLAGIKALDFEADMRARVDALVEERHRLGAALARLPGLIVYPSGANFLLVRVESGGHALWQRLVDRGVLVRDFSDVPRLTDCLRITVGTPAEDDHLLAAMRESLDGAA
jgi:histidinol-phosphate aminotransferase